MKSVFNDLLEMTKKQPEPQRLLFLFAQTDDTKGKIKKHQRGSISPVMCVDKLPEELSDFASLKKEADSVSKDWEFMFIAGLSGADGKAPSSNDAEPYLNKMTNDLANGQDLSRYVVINRDEQPIEIAPF
ncbi:ribonucleotide reductase subunit alpha [Bacterioplanoides sp. SCSIO 12839]|uniref:ribonucleotide reductase subunit alpha n=1 Tax=Bacterioplanoides sp. SCSIO 12839 TaxID=2829569 RepID=UPI0021080987|nr:ribonucleotide reductase subunit alpha [Bacterioplanoides sp. SCSIO 12839]UTW49321.1 ribonucleotide reductase subunit alpha [Bacterioplanoides sp. SCSIO 12839]